MSIITQARKAVAALKAVYGIPVSALNSRQRYRWVDLTLCEPCS